MPERPNILMFITHDSGRHFGCYGRRVATLNVDRLAEEGVLFSNHYSTAPQCSPSRSSIISGKYPHTHGVMGLTHRGHRMHCYENLVPHLMSGAGYQTWLFGMQHEVHAPSPILGYQNRRFDEQKGNACQIVTPFVLDWLSQGPTQPFYACIGYHESHRPFPHSDTPLETVQPLPYLPDVPPVRQDLADLEVLIRRIDDHVGLVIDGLKRAGLYDNTLIIFTTDHGIDMPRAKGTLFNAGVETAFIMRFPGGRYAGRRVDALAQNIDYLPTICEMAGPQVPPGVQGTSLMPLVCGRKTCVHETLLFENTYQSAYDPVRAVRAGSYKYIKSFIARPINFAANTGPGPAKQYLLEQGWFDGPRPAEQLYDLAKDPHEMTDIAGRPEYAQVLRQMQAHLQRWMTATKDPLLTGQVRPPLGGRVTCPDSLDGRNEFVATENSPIE